ncbi:MAG: polyprenyl synthetase family protein [Nitrospirae bacterium]|nr:polyprenyl synthetase family protein [Nitrospirota bacterium]
MDIDLYIKEKKALVDAFLERYFSHTVVPETLHKSITYSLSAGGKRIRPVLCLAAYEACGRDPVEAVPYATAFELIHTYSLIHDDLPAMDDDDLRRGKPTNHKVFGEGMAILAGDALLTEAFYLLSNMNSLAIDREGAVPESAILKMIHELAGGAGMLGMVGGQAQDLLSENEEPDAETLFFIHKCKTAALITSSVKAGGILACCSEEKLGSLERYGENTGFAFQVVDDILDVEGETEVLGKTAGSDEKKKKMTYPKLYGIDESRRRARELVDMAIEALTSFDEKADPLRKIAQRLLERRS